MNINWSIPVGTIVLLAVQVVGSVIGIMRLVATLERRIDSRFTDIALLMNTFKEGDIRELRGRLTTLESGQDEWTKALRQRSHDLGDTMQTILLKIDRLERAGMSVRATDAP